MEVEEFVLEDEGDYGVYLIDGEVHESNTSKLSYSWGADKNQIRTQFVEPAAREINREWKRRLAAHEKPLSQDEAISIAFAGIKKHKEQYTVFGTEMHKAFQNFDESKPLNLPTPKHQAFFQGFLYFRKQHEIKPILIEKLLVCPHCGITTQIDNFSEVDGLNTVMDYKTGRTVGFNTPFQLAINKHVLENLGYTVHRTWAVHIQDLFGYPLEMCAPWEDVELRLKNADLKRKTLNPKIYQREFSGERKAFTVDDKLISAAKAVADVIKKEASDIKSETSEEQEPAHETNSQGHQHRQEATEISAKFWCSVCKQSHLPGDTCPYLADTQLPETTDRLLQPAQVTEKRRRGRPRKDPSANISSRKADSRPQTPPEEVELNPKHVHPKRLKRRLFQQAA